MKTTQPWLNNDGSLKTDSEIKSICHSWSPSTWEAYLKNFESSQTECLIGEADIFADSLQSSHVEVYKSLLAQNEYPILQMTVEAALSSLSEKEQIVIHLLFWEGMSQKSVAEKLGVNRKTVASYKDRALTKLSKFLIEGAVSNGVRFLNLAKLKDEEANLPPKLDQIPIGGEAS